jgi:hypothetical protein
MVKAALLWDTEIDCHVNPMDSELVDSVQVKAVADPCMVMTYGPAAPIADALDCWGTELELVQVPEPAKVRVPDPA